MHINPEDAIQGFRDLQAKTLIPMHYGTFDLSSEPFGEPLRRLSDCRWPGLHTVAVGENYFLPGFPFRPNHFRVMKEAAAFDFNPN
jgi:L-ascorbate metabolism protein UlaG (beta-lactamase superfamily)